MRLLDIAWPGLKQFGETMQFLLSFGLCIQRLSMALSVVVMVVTELLGGA